MKKVIRLTESELEDIIKRVISEQSNQPVGSVYREAADELLRKGPKPSGAGEKYCFTKEKLAQDIANTGYKNVDGGYSRILHKIKQGDTYNEFQNKTEVDLQEMNPFCKNLKNDFRVGDIIQYQTKGPHSR